MSASAEPAAKLDPQQPPVRSRIAAAAAINADLVGIDLLPTGNGYTVIELNGAVDFDASYALPGSDIFRDAADALGLLPADTGLAATA